jgi:hypothetical protein
VHLLHIDCSNVIAGETWNLCTDDVPETSPFIVVTNNNRFEEPTCTTGGGGGLLGVCQSLLEQEFGANPPCTCVSDGLGGFDVDCDILAVCDTFLELELGPDAPCTCVLFGEDDFDIECDCVLQACETIQGQETCIELDEEAANALELEVGPDTFVDCFQYGSGPFDNAICLIEDFSDDTCTITLDGNECASCAFISCDNDDGTSIVDDFFDDDDDGNDGVFGLDVQFDCSNLIGGETWNLCTDNIPETSPFIAVGNNDLFSDPSCKPETVEAPSQAPSISEVVDQRPTKKQMNKKNMKQKKQKNMKQKKQKNMKQKKQKNQNKQKDEKGQKKMKRQM